MTAIWAGVTAVVNKSKCWWGYAETYTYFFLEGPRLIVILVRKENRSSTHAWGNFQCFQV
jgi:hypothetical protein